MLAALRAAGVEYALTGSYAASYWGVPRSTHSIDLVTVAEAQQAEAIVQALGENWYADAQMIAQAAGGAGHFNLIHTETGIRVYCWLVGDEEYDRERFARRVVPEPTQPDLVVPAAEDVILSKLRWLQQGGGERHLEDIRGILRLQRENLDLAYLRQWAARLGLGDALAQVTGPIG